MKKIITVTAASLLLGVSGLATANSEEAAALEEELEANETCSKSRLYRAVVVD